MNNLLKRAVPFFRRNSATILTCAGAVGVVTTSVLAVKATPKAISLIKEAEKKKGEDLTKTEMVITAGPAYIPTIVTGAATIACIFGANVLNKRKQAALMSAYALLDNSYKDYKRKLIELHGKETHEEIVDAIAAEKAENKPISGAYFVQSTDLEADIYEGEEMLFYLEHTQKFFTSTMERVLNAEYHLNRNYILRGYSVLNEFYDFLGLEPTDYGSEVGWTPDDESMYWIEFDHRKTMIKDVECVVIDMPFEPSTTFQDYSYW